ncbi:indolepyruvate oxidoreductase subunit beta [Parabacteroides sp. FAFU027]|uniref:indolepyruvate oxidoreductase subunit beta n=1 Tax=Parabacteroides sp. FAFU027 TaxID=2922715 RepID=UPI001FAEE2FC|nr:indolepyruvate oxidoreductase subunit beta [Parabacteroides sp. FAFU027]
MIKNIIIAGVGGQGILTIASIIDLAAMHNGLYVKQAEVHGMSQRGGEVQSHLRISNQEIYSDLIPMGKADLILSVEPMEALRYLPYLSETGTIVTATEAFKNIPNYPDEAELAKSIDQSAKTLFVNAHNLAVEVGNPKSYNIVMLGAAAPFIGIDAQQIEWAIGQLFGAKGEEVVTLNVAAFHKGLALAKEFIK